MRDADVTDAELARAKDQIIKSFPARFATRANVAAQLAELAVYGLPDSYLTDYTKKIAAVTKDDIRRVARKYLDPSRLTIVVVGDQKTLAEPLGEDRAGRAARPGRRPIDGPNDRHRPARPSTLPSRTTIVRMPSPGGGAQRSRPSARRRSPRVLADARAERRRGPRQGGLRVHRPARSRWGPIRCIRSSTRRRTCWRCSGCAGRPRPPTRATPTAGRRSRSWRRWASAC